MISFEQRLFPPCLPVNPGYQAENLFEFLVNPAFVQLSLELSDIPLLAIITTHLIKHFDKYSQEGVYLGFADNIRFLVDVEQDAF